MAAPVSGGPIASGKKASKLGTGRRGFGSGGPGDGGVSREDRWSIVYPPGQEGFLHYHDQQDELYFVHSGRAIFEIEGERRELGPGGLCHVESTTPRKVTNASDEDELVLLVVGGSGGYVERDGHLVDPERDLARRQSFGA